MTHAVVFLLDVDITLERIGDLVSVGLPDLLGQRTAHR